jgi:hypothetical protein
VIGGPAARGMGRSAARANAYAKSPSRMLASYARDREVYGPIDPVQYERGYRFECIAWDQGQRTKRGKRRS